MVPTTRPLLAATTFLLLAGCVTDPDTDGPDDDPAPRLTVQGPDDLPMEGTRLHAHLTPGTMNTWEVAVRHAGGARADAYEHREGCGNPWSMRLTDDRGSDIPWDEPRAQCMGFQSKVLLPGQTHSFTWAWDGKTWDEREGNYGDAAPGAYTATFRFAASQDGRDASVTGATTFQVR